MKPETNNQNISTNVSSEVDTSNIGKLSNKVIAISLIVGLLGQLLIFLVSFFIYSLLAYESANASAFVISLVVAVILEIIVILSITLMAASSIRPVTHAISSLIGEKPSVVPPNPNEQSGIFKNESAKAITYLYENYRTNMQSTSDAQDRQGELALSLLSALPVGIIALDQNLRILAFNNKAPIIQGANGKTIQLDFRNSNISLANWLTNVAAKEIYATNIWTRIQNVPSGSLEERHVYDVVACYNQQATNGLPLIVVTLDRTSDYAESEDNIDFVALAAHELRGPVTVIRGYLDMLNDEIYDKSSDEQKALLDRLSVSAKRLASYVNNVLNANRYDRHHLKLKLVESNVYDIFSDIERDLNLRATTVNRHISWDIPKDLPTVAADQSSIGEVITNLVDNAIKYSGEGGQIEVSATRTGDFVAISVKDHGIGIPYSVTKNLFTKFYRSHRSSTSVGGTGIGLYISRAIVESHGGTIGVSSTEGEGSTFTFTLPIYDTVKSKLESNNNSNESLITSNTEWIDNHGSITK